MAVNTLVQGILKTVVTSGAIGLLTFMGYGIVNNDIRNTEQHTDIRKEVQIGDEKSIERIDDVKDIVTDIRIEQTEQRVLLQEIRRKL